MNYTEQAVTFACKQETLAGILAVPKTATASSTGVIIIVGGPQYRVGSHRQFVLLSRALAAEGYPVLRFDYRGMGDSSGEQRDFLQVTPDIAAAINAMQAELPRIKNVALWGLCDGASAALLYCHETDDPRVGGLCLLNPWVRSEASLARTQVKHYYVKRVMQKEFWAKLLRGGVAADAVTGLVRNIRLASDGAGRFGRVASAPGRTALSQQPFQSRMAAAWDNFAGGVFLLLSGEDYTAKEFLEYIVIDAAWKNAPLHPRLLRYDVHGADHTLSSASARMAVENRTLEWLRRQVSSNPSDRK